MDVYEGHIKAHFGGKGVVGFGQKFRCGLTICSCYFWLNACSLWRGIDFYDFGENQCVPIYEDEIYFTDLAAPTMCQYFIGTGGMIGSYGVLDRETRQVIFFL